MSTTATVRNYVEFTGDLEQGLIFDTGELLDSPAIQNLVTLASGNNSVAVPDVTDFDVHGLVIVPPSLNTETITLKGVNGDTGIPISMTQATVIQLGADPTVVLNAGAEIVGVRLIWF